MWQQYQATVQGHVPNSVEPDVKDSQVYVPHPCRVLKYDFNNMNSTVKISGHCSSSRGHVPIKEGDNDML